MELMKKYYERCGVINDPPKKPRVVVSEKAFNCLHGGQGYDLIREAVELEVERRIRLQEAHLKAFNSLFR
ncbi:hypothetical protein TCA2_4601 [Paenibacillus sp. TCA20]|uniref:hypothetical protein n=1 Tax=Paenibacillus sp. TCA20 TaxID=1499968 RepID=UPI0004DA2781|nr:hypothetical protein [Paenibacillus sp. TCA20]GAK42109.1 hypothetical protein TCA2_4601 [Paenibacillus sp. TCA20]